MKKKVIVTGCAGFIGSNLVDLLLKKNFSVLGIDNLSTGHLRNLDDANKNKNFHRIIDNQTTTGYIIKHNFISTLLPVFEASVSKLKNGGDPNTWALDSCWKPLQLTRQFWYHNDIFAGQLPGYSDIEKRQVNYNKRFVMQNLY